MIPWNNTRTYYFYFNKSAFYHSFTKHFMNVLKILKPTLKISWQNYAFSFFLLCMSWNIPSRLWNKTFTVSQRFECGFLWAKHRMRINDNHLEIVHQIITLFIYLFQQIFNKCLLYVGHSYRCYEVTMNNWITHVCSEQGRNRYIRRRQGVFGIDGCCGEE